MKAETRQLLVDINRRFYQHHSQAFDGSRQRPWRGWQRLPELVDARPLSVLDVGCGNGRLASYLAEQLDASDRPSPLRYVGVDSSSELLAQAAERPAVDQLIPLDLLQGDLPQAVAAETFDLVGAFGVLHHLPGSATRRRFLDQLAKCCRPGGVVVVSIWQLDRQPRFPAKVLPWEDFLDDQPQHRALLSAEDLEAGDYLLTWSGDRSVPRYCHFPSDGEIDDWIHHLPCPLVERWHADGASGDTNLYLAFRR